MPARKNKLSTKLPSVSALPVQGDIRSGMVLVVHPVKARRDMLVRTLESLGHSCVAAPTANAAAEAMESREIGSVLVAESLAEKLAELPLITGRRILLCDKVDIQSARRAISLCCDDILDDSCGAQELEGMLAKAKSDAATRNGSSTREKRLLGLCRKLNDSRKELSKELTRLCADMTQSYADLAGKIDTVAIAGEFTGLVRQELELESLMRTSLEFLLAKLGSMNAALFLPSSSGDWSLGAYVNYDRARDSAEMMLDHLADTAPHRLSEIGHCVRFDTESQIAEALPGAVEWLSDCAVLGAPAIHEGETLACLLFFRDQSTPFPEHAKETMEAISKILASQFARVIKVHHRHLPKEEWASPGDPMPPAGDLDDQDDLLC